MHVLGGRAAPQAKLQICSWEEKRAVCMAVGGMLDLHTPPWFFNGLGAIGFTKRYIDQIALHGTESGGYVHAQALTPRQLDAVPEMHFAEEAMP